MPKAWCSSKYPVFPSIESSTLLQNHQFGKKKKKKSKHHRARVFSLRKELDEIQSQCFQQEHRLFTACLQVSLAIGSISWKQCSESEILMHLHRWYQRGFQSCDFMVSLQRYPGL